MGWTNYVIIPDLKLAIETSRHILCLDDYEKESIDYLVEEKDIDDIGDTKVTCLTINELAELAITHDKVYNLNGVSPDKFLIYWLLNRKIDYKITSEYNIKIEELKTQGYTIIRLYSEEEKTEKEILDELEKEDLWND